MGKSYRDTSSIVRALAFTLDEMGNHRKILREKSHGVIRFKDRSLTESRL